MENAFSFKYKNRFKSPMDNIQYVFIEITTKTGVGPFLNKSPHLYSLKPISYGNTKAFYHPKYGADNISNQTPDYCSTLYWNPHVLTNAQGRANINFYVSDRKGTYTVWIEGSDMEGGIGMSTMKIEIK